MGKHLSKIFASTPAASLQLNELISASFLLHELCSCVSLTMILCDDVQKKRKHDAVPNGGDADAACVKRRQPADPPSTPAPISDGTHRPPSLLDLPVGVMVEIAKCISIAGVDEEKPREGSNTLIALCIVVGPFAARFIRDEYLRNNLFFLGVLYEDAILFADYIEAGKVKEGRRGLKTTQGRLLE